MDSANSGGSMQSSSGGEDDYGAVDSSQSGDFSDFLGGSNPPIHDQQHHQSSLMHFPSMASAVGSFPLSSFHMDSFIQSPQPMPLDVPNCSSFPSGSPTLHRGPAPDDVPCCSAGVGALTPAWQHNGAPSTEIAPPPAGTNPSPPASVPAKSLAPARDPSSSSKKRSRASRRAPTTVLTTDTANFRQMVQEFTGIPSPPFSTFAFPTRPRTSPTTAAFDILHAAAAAAASTALPYRSSGSSVGGLGLLESSGLLRSLVKRSLNPPYSTGPSSSSSAPSCTSTSAATAVVLTANSVSSGTTSPISTSNPAATAVHGATTWPAASTSVRSSSSCVANANRTGAPAGSSYGMLSQLGLGNDPSDLQLQSPLMCFSTQEPRSLPLPFQQTEGLPVFMALEGASSSAPHWNDRSGNVHLTTVSASSICRSGGGTGGSSGCNQTGQMGQRPLEFHAEKSQEKSSVASIGEGMVDSTWICSLDN